MGFFTYVSRRMCRPQSDGVVNTSKQEKPTRGCPVDHPVVDIICLGDDLPVPVTHFLNYYRYIDCMYEFTPGQVQLMKANRGIYRVWHTPARQDNPLVLDEAGSGDVYFVQGVRQVFTLVIIPRIPDVSLVTETKGMLTCLRAALGRLAV